MNIACESQSREPVGSRLAQVRGKMTQDEFGKELGLTRRQVSTMERGEVPITGDVFIAIHQKFGVSLSWLLLGDGPTYVLGEHLTEEEREIVSVARRIPYVVQLIRLIESDGIVQKAIFELARALEEMRDRVTSHTLTIGKHFCSERMPSSGSRKQVATF